VRVGERLVEMLMMEAVLITLDRDGMALVRADGRSELLATRPRQVYDITGAGDMVLAVVGLCVASGADYDEAAALGNVAGGLEVEKFGVSLLTREEILRDLVDHHHAEGCKILGRDQLVAEVHRRRLAGQRIVFTNGCFDILHVGHVRLLEQAAALGDYLVVGVNSDASVQQLKGPKRPLNPAEARAEVLSALGTVNAVTVFDAETPLELITAIRPHVLVKGGDYHPDQVVGRLEVEAAGGQLVLIPLLAGHSTTSLLHRAVERELTPHVAEPVPPPHRARAVSAARIHDARG
jgi:D-beta-D-heptose 7-phosphate kinase/D-beta-D-heptose 1-phosphate adenosyltransferase